MPELNEEIVEFRSNVMLDYQCTDKFFRNVERLPRPVRTDRTSKFSDTSNKLSYSVDLLDNSMTRVFGRTIEEGL